MLERIQSVKGVGLLHDADGRRYGFQKATFIYADNGRGKSTLASLFRSCSTNNTKLIVNRRTVDGTNDQEVVLQFSSGQKHTFKNGAWDRSRPEILVFDSDFVEENVYAGGHVSSDQRKNLLKFALGATAVVAQQDYDRADEDWKIAANLVREITSNLAVAHKGLTLSEFKNIQAVPDADNQIITLNSRIAEARKNDFIQNKPLPNLLEYPKIIVSPIFEILRTAITDIDIAAEQKVKSHLLNHKKHGLERWISEGISFGLSDFCLFCNQPLNGVEIIRAYQSYFNQDYNRLKNNVASLSILIHNICSNGIIDRLRSQFESANAVIDGWQEYIETPRPTFNEDEARNALVSIQNILEALKQEKESNLLDSIGNEEHLNQINDKLQVINHVASLCNIKINNAIQQIIKYKQGLQSVNIENLQKQISELELVKVRFRPDIVALIDQLHTSEQGESAAQSVKQNKKTLLNQVMRATLDNYKVRINQLLQSFSAQFLIPNIEFDYRGSLRSDYSIEMRGTKITLSGGIPDFKTSLSEGDKRTLAFAFFIASTESAPDLANKIIVIDDPMCSLDLNRKQQTRTVLKKLYENSKQLVIIAHDGHFLRNLRDDILRTDSPNNIKFLRLKAVSNRYSDFGDIDIDQECESAYFKCHRLFEKFRSGNAQSSMEVARSIRPMLEGYLHRRFPSLIKPDILFGDVVRMINDAQPPSPLVHAQNITKELNEINRYAGQFHHDTNPAADQVQIVDTELLGFVERAINVIYAGKV